MATNAPTPDGYTSVFTNKPASLQAANYMGLYTLDSYDTLTCASKCDQAAGCAAFNVYLERDPTVNANQVSCPNPPSTTNYRCTLWGAPVCPEEATNTGQYQASFHVVIAGSNGSCSPHHLVHQSKTCKQRTTKLPHHLLLVAMLVLRNLAARSMPQLPLAATWVTNSSPLAKAKDIPHRHVQMLAMPRQLTIAGTRQLTAATCHAYVPNTLS